MERQAKHFSEESLKNILAAEGKVVSGIICYFWLNRINPQALVELIDNIELKFTDESSLIISCSEEVEGMEVMSDFNVKEEQEILDKEFGGKIKIIPIDAAKTKMWQDIPGMILESIDLTRDGDHYLSDTVLLNFGEEKRIITLSPTDGLIMDYYEE